MVRDSCLHAWSRTPSIPSILAAGVVYRARTVKPSHMSPPRGQSLPAATHSEAVSYSCNAALAVGIPREDIYIDCLTLTASAQQKDVLATVQALDADQLRAALACLNAAHVVEVAAASHNLSIALEASVKFGSLGKRCVASAIPEKTRAFAATLTKNDLLLVISGTGRNPALEEVARLARENGAAILLITSDRHSPLAQQADHVLLASNREQRLIEGDHAPSQLSVLLVIEVLYYLMLLGE